MQKTSLTELLHQGKAEEVSHILKLLAHPMRLKLLCHLIEREQSVLDLAGLCGGTQVSTSQALAHLKSDGLVQCRKDGQFVFYSLADARIAALMRAVKNIFCEPASKKAH